MKWRGRQGSRNIEDRRRSGGGGSGAKIGGLGLIVILLMGAFFGVDVTPFLQQTGPNQGGGASTEITAEDEAAGQFVSVALRDTEVMWEQIFRNELGRAYEPATLVLFKGRAQSPCGMASGASGPFYCPADRKAYLDTDFFTTLSREMGAGGDFAAAYVVAHEVAHHVQNVLGILPKVNQIRSQVSQREANRLSVLVELQADCYSGIWARFAQDSLGTLDEGDLAEAVNAAKQIGDDILQRKAGRYPNPHTFTHGTSEQRSSWFVRGYQSGQISQCDTFSHPNP
ncbi:MAG: neutral zinc metallopeptidase [Pseudomonadota bacterium]